MFKKALIILSCFLSLLAVEAYEPYYNRPTANQALKSDFSEYMENVQNLLQKNWITPDFLEEAHVRVLFKIDRFGNVVSGDILESSGNLIYDESAVNAIHKSEPFGMFPENTSRQYITVNYSFDTKLIKTDKVQELYNLAKRYRFSDKRLALEYINKAIEEVGSDEESYILYNCRGKIKEGLGDHVSAKSDFDQYKKFKSRVDIRRLHAMKYQAEQEDSAFIYYYLAYAYELVEDYENAIKSIDKAIERTDLNQQYKKYRSQLIEKSVVKN